MGARKAGLIVFLGPSLPLAEAKRLAPGAQWRPPARQGDVWAALAKQPAAIALIDGVFESTPSVWHHELIAALDAGVTVFGAASMGALRAAELSEQGMLGVGTVYGWLRSGVVEDDAEVALLHGSAEDRYRALTVPLVNVRAAAASARKAKVLPPRAASALITAATEVFYQERTWPRVLQAVGARWSPAVHARFEAFRAQGLPDLKAQDARECLQAAQAFVRSGAPAPSPRPGRPPSSLVRQRRLSPVIQKLRTRLDARALAEEGVLRLTLAAWARGLGLAPPPAEVQRLREEFDAQLAAGGLDAGERVRYCETLALVQLVVEHAPRLVPDGPGFDEGLAFETLRRTLC